MSRISSILFVICIVSLWTQCLSRIVPFSPCPKLFNYFESETFEVFGAMRFDNDYSGHYKLEVEMSIATNTDQNIKIRRVTPDYKIQNGESIEYYVIFPFNHTFPKMTRITFQGLLHCVGPKEEGDAVTPLKAKDEVQLEIVSSLRPKAPPTTNKKPTSQVILNIFPNDAECGQNSEYTPLIVNGDETKSGEFPWLVAIFRSVDNNYSFLCAATLITKQHVVTAAHCVKNADGSLADKRNLLFILGKHNIRYWPIGSQIRSATDIYVHPDYKQPSNADIAIIRLNTAVDYGATVKPACVWNENDNVESVVGDNGTVAGWGRDEHANTYVENARKVDLAVIDVFDCIKQDARFSTFTSRNTFCGGNGRGAVPCTGDSGGGFVMKRADNKYYIRGIVSATLKTGLEPCDVTKNTVFTDIAKYAEWMKTKVED